ncbi:4-hydroxythreonine-4-phosphate dehydrogenase PdxA [Solilutibacter silvestris]|uniref:4-hydroxythreonine-4-phosphate dehydrogenase n=1 Tax=Solilutibacter silvestris TaxID=1645665 RepID=A0A2K1PXU5_9GAMM|nr:4-hydroxythreonine-4-phosphate dehydrogenase PdxA [Lysobacter silvestris]PNS07507.1 pdxA: 4-hydroxythreonine-4-phosphate dehydrogenase PdxA [Lysobacter silvestris]
MTIRLALVPGEPAGIGPELCVRLAQRVDLSTLCTAYADPDVLMQAASALRLPLELLDSEAEITRPGQLRLIEYRLPTPTRAGQPDPANAPGIIAALDAAAHDCLDGRMHGLVTGPFHKAAINDGGIAYTGTTERLAQQAGSDMVMMLARPGLRVALVTTHLPLRAVADAISGEQLERILTITADALRRDFGIASPRIAVLGLNPHAGEDGHLGREELDIIIPTLERLRARGLHLDGPLPADTAFLPHKLATFDAVVAMYHDQGLPVLKSTGLEHAVNITLGLPYPRVAVDHGTALDIAGTGRATPDSLFAAVAQCAQFAAQREQDA